MTDIIHCYTRAEAIADGVLFDVSERAVLAGFRIPVALTRAAWEKCIAVSENASNQDVTGHICHVLVCFFFSLHRAQARGSLVRFPVAVLKSPRIVEDIELLAVCGPGDNAQTVITIMLQEEG